MTMRMNETAMAKLIEFIDWQSVMERSKKPQGEWTQEYQEGYADGMLRAIELINEFNPQD